MAAQRNTGITDNQLTSIAVSPATTTIYAGTLGGGVFRTLDNGSSWSAINTGITDLDVELNQARVDETVTAVVW